LGGTNQQVTVLFADIRGFTRLAEASSPERVVAWLNEYFSEVAEIIFRHHGTLDKFIGDGLMALFGAPRSTMEDAANAVRAAIDMQRRMAGFSDEMSLEGYPRFGIGIGINTGVATVGYIGSERRTDYTAIGDTVNVAARLEQTAAIHQIRISQQTLTAVGSLFPVRSLGQVPVKGRAEPVEVFEVLWEAAPPPEGLLPTQPL
jgi:adenylate cyclase